MRIRSQSPVRASRWPVPLLAALEATACAATHFLRAQRFFSSCVSSLARLRVRSRGAARGHGAFPRRLRLCCVLGRARRRRGAAGGAGVLPRRRCVGIAVRPAARAAAAPAAALRDRGPRRGGGRGSHIRRGKILRLLDLRVVRYDFGRGANLGEVEVEDGEAGERANAGERDVAAAHIQASMLR